MKAISDQSNWSAAVADEIAVEASKHVNAFDQTFH